MNKFFKLRFVRSPENAAVQHNRLISTAYRCVENYFIV